MRFLPLPQLISCERGITMIEAVIAMGILGVVIVGGSFHMKNVNHSLRSMQEFQTADALELNLFKIFSNDANVRYTVAKSGISKLINCVKGSGLCTDKAKYPVSFYVNKQSTPFAGKSVYYSKDGSPCLQNSCRSFQILTEVITYCSGKATCVFPTHLAVKFNLKDVKTGKSYRSNLVEMVVEQPTAANAYALRCPSGDQILRGIGFSGKVLCTKANKVKYADADNFKGGNKFKVEPRDCRTENNAGDPKDQHAINKLDKDGKLSCVKKNW